MCVVRSLSFDYFMLHLSKNHHPEIFSRAQIVTYIHLFYGLFHNLQKAAWILMRI